VRVPTKIVPNVPRELHLYSITPTDYFSGYTKPPRLSIFAGFPDYSPLVKGLKTILLHKKI